MSRLHVHIAVDNIEQNIRFYSALFGVKPTVAKSDYVKWELSNPSVNFAISNRGKISGLDHIGVQAENEEELKNLQQRLQDADIQGVAQEGAACCYARSDKYWSTDPQGIAWEAFHTLDTVPTFNDAETAQQSSSCCVPVMPTSSQCC
jgi:catechol 2,3-dioxygenase-like lactoylglutathione lyase family enzyme